MEIFEYKLVSNPQNWTFKYILKFKQKAECKYIDKNFFV